MLKDGRATTTWGSVDPGRLARSTGPSRRCGSGNEPAMGLVLLRQRWCRPVPRAAVVGPDHAPWDPVGGARGRPCPSPAGTGDAPPDGGGVAVRSRRVGPSCQSRDR